MLVLSSAKPIANASGRDVNGTMRMLETHCLNLGVKFLRVAEHLIYTLSAALLSFINPCLTEWPLYNVYNPLVSRLF